MAVHGDGDVEMEIWSWILKMVLSAYTHLESLMGGKVKLPQLQGSIRNLNITRNRSLVLATLDKELVLVGMSFVVRNKNLKSAFKNIGLNLNLKQNCKKAPIVFMLTTSNTSIFLTGHILHNGQFS